MSRIKHWDNMVKNAGLENVASFLCNVESALHQGLGALESCAQQGAGAVLQCPYCGEYLARSFTAKVFLSSAGHRPSILVMVFDCPECEEVVETEIMPCDNITLPF